MNRAHEEGQLLKVFLDNGLTRINQNEEKINNSEDIKNYDFHSSYDDNDLNAITDVTLSNLDIGRSVNHINCKNRKSINSESNSRKSEVAINIVGDSSTGTWDDSTIKSNSTFESNNKFDYCLDYIKSNYLSSNNEGEAGENSKEHKKIKRNNKLLNEAERPTKTSINDWKITYSHFDISKRELTPNHEVLSVIRGRLCKADAEIQLKKLKILNRKLPFAEY